ncbi:hypothetical protein P175DRAFT_0493546 [Aspergillus ochraceoroseus IBT 24754]|uniref:ribonuclease T1 n=3 Tax=Aspergillus subgen. Nidulantes TaxID=2720870 RepID=A0A0F8WS88_9EURO|nr:uncharacterized protein P175DRAFT_0493546 [Aspergillus ochraceoroseus IBT 24754]KKK20520.1 hypothetical protein ARAM_001113 [Aspergillus rambellii]KKK24240.1 hypothetical protein AOCH_001399 [Aspergillus ochraceoroseus]PTU21274.1 hypothetical protein P175DRAFT_0493546 [Aspergillus ochraceoroseus IBT 24754]
MVQLKTLLTVLCPLLLSSAVAAVPTGENAGLKNRDSCAYTCGSTCYRASDVSDAQEQGYSLYQSGETVHNYPHVYHDYEGFDFPVSGTYYEFPIMSSYEVYTGGSPGADRVIFNENDEFAGMITHTGASGDDFVQCSS